MRKSAGQIDNNQPFSPGRKMRGLGRQGMTVIDRRRQREQRIGAIARGSQAGHGTTQKVTPVHWICLLPSPQSTNINSFAVNRIRLKLDQLSNSSASAG